MEEYKHGMHTLKYSGIFDDSFILIKTTKPIMGIKYDLNEDEYQVIYMTKDKKLKKSGKNLFIKEYIGGVSSLLMLKEFLSNNLSILSFFDDLTRKKRMVCANDKLFEPKEVASFNRYKESLPDEKYTLLNMPVCSRTAINKLTKIVNYDIEIKKSFALEQNILKDKTELNVTDSCNKIFLDYKFMHTESEEVWDETANDIFKKHTYDEIQSISYYEFKRE